MKQNLIKIRSLGYRRTIKETEAMRKLFTVLPWTIFLAIFSINTFVVVGIMPVDNMSRELYLILILPPILLAYATLQYIISNFTQHLENDYNEIKTIDWRLFDLVAALAFLFAIAKVVIN
jgi:hypothetical protein